MTDDVLFKKHIPEKAMMTIEGNWSPKTMKIIELKLLTKWLSKRQTARNLGLDQIFE